MGNTMRDMLRHLDRLQEQVGECELIRDLATDKGKREIFANLAEHLKIGVEQIEKALAAAAADQYWNYGYYTDGTLQVFRQIRHAFGL
jgi:hypothetical protein